MLEQSKPFQMNHLALRDDPYTGHKRIMNREEHTANSDFNIAVNVK